MLPLVSCLDSIADENRKSNRSSFLARYLDNGKKLVLSAPPPCFAEWIPPSDAITKVGEGAGGKDLDSGMSRIARLARQNIQLVTDKRAEDRAKAEEKAVTFAKGTKGDGGGKGAGGKAAGKAASALSLFETERQKAVRALDEERRKKGVKRKERVLQNVTLWLESGNDRLRAGFILCEWGCKEWPVDTFQLWNTPADFTTTKTLRLYSYKIRPWIAHCRSVAPIHHPT